MIEQDRYIRMVLHMEQDVNWLRDRMIEYQRAFKPIFGELVYHKACQRLELLLGNIQEMKQDLRTQGLI